MAKSHHSFEPKYVPAPFKRYGAADGAEAGEFWGSEQQVAVRYHRSNSFRVQKLTVCWDPAVDQVLVGTDQRPGMPVKIKGAEARYHDGSWAPGLGPEQVKGPLGVLHWDRTREHSLTLHTNRGTFAVRAPRDAVPDPAELVRIMSSMALE